MFQLEPTGWFSWAFTVQDAGRPVAAFDVSAWRERGGLQVAGQPFTVAREGLVSGRFRLESRGTIVATATKPSVLRRGFEVAYGGRTLSLRPRSAWSRTLVVREGERDIGDVTPRGLWSRRATATLPDTLPAPVHIFLLWLAVLIWKRDAESAAA